MAVRLQTVSGKTCSYQHGPPTDVCSCQQFPVVLNSGGDGPWGITMWEMNALLLFAG